MAGNDTPELRAALRAQISPEVDQLLAKGGQPIDDETLGRWLRARKGKVSDAARDLTEHAKWRAEFCPSGYISEDEVRAELDQAKVFLQGVDTQGHPLTILIAERHVPANLDICKRFICFTLDAGRRMGETSGVVGWDGKGSAIFDLSGMTMANYDLGALRAVFDLLQNHYPEGLHKLYLYEAPFIFYGLWRLVSPFVDPVTREKVVFVSKAEAAVEFKKVFPQELLPAQFGGTAELRPIEKAVASLPGHPHNSVKAVVAEVEAAADQPRVLPQEVEVRAS